LALALSGHVHHTATASWLEGVEVEQSVLFCRATQQSLLQLLTTAAVLAPYGNPPLTNNEAWDVYQAFIADERIGQLADEPPGVEARWGALASRSVASPKLWMDAYLAAFATCAGLRLVTTDAAFSQFPRLRVLVLGSS
jgi:toxin-antitoxin system PIN domain toxin